MSHSTYWKKVLSVFTGAAVAQAIPIVGALVIARLYAPDAFGIFSTWLGVSLVISVFITYRLEHSFGLEPDGKSRERVVLATAVLVVSTGVIYAVLCGLLLLLIENNIGPLAPSLIILLFPMSVGAALSQVWQSWAANNGEIKRLSLIRISQTFCVTSLQILSGYFSPEPLMLILAQITGVWISVVFAWTLLPLNVTKLKRFSYAHLLVQKIFLRHKRFPLFALPADLINTVAAQAPILVLASRFGPEIAGYYALSTRMMGAPISILGGAVRDVFKRAAGQQFRSVGNCRKIYMTTFYVLLGCSVMMVFIALPFLEHIFIFFFGPTWKLSGVIAAWLLPMYALGFIASPLSYTFYIAQKQNVDLIWQVSLLLITVATLNLFNSYRNIIIAYSIGYAGMYIIYLYMSYLYSKGSDISGPE